MLPRLAGGLIIGYVLLLFTAEVWEFVAELTTVQYLGIFTISLLVSLGYLYIEVKNILLSRRYAFKRALRIFAIGALESLVAGVILLDLCTEGFLAPLDVELPFVPGLFGEFSPRVLMLYFPLALLIGIFVQIIWEDKPVTLPL